MTRRVATRLSSAPSRRSRGDRPRRRGSAPARGRQRGFGRHGRRGITLGLVAVVLAMGVTVPAEAALSRVNLVLALVLLGLLVVLGVAGDLVAIAAAAASESALHAMAARRRPGARYALSLKRHADRVASISGDLVGDTAGTMSGAAAAGVVLRLAGGNGWSEALLLGATIGLVAGLTVGGKALMKGIGLDYANQILYVVGGGWYGLARLTGRAGRRRS